MITHLVQYYYWYNKIIGKKIDKVGSNKPIVSMNVVLY